MKFLEESFLIEGIVRPPSEQELSATKIFIALRHVTVLDLKKLVNAYEPEARFRSKSGLDVRVGNHVPPPGGQVIEELLTGILREIDQNLVDPWQAHLRYQSLHPFTDGNGRSGRTLWVWHMLRTGANPFLRGFLHQFYYQTLSHGD